MTTKASSGRVRGGSPLTDMATMYDRVTDRLRTEIMTGKLQPNARLKAPEVAARLGVSPSPVREALQKLQAEGLILLKPNYGAVVRGLDADEFVHAMRLRAAIEGMQAGLCATLADDALLGRIEQAAERFEVAVQSGERDKRVKANSLFHELIIGCDGSEIAREIVERVHTITAALRRQHPQSTDRFESAVTDHRALIEALRRRDAEAAERIARRHVLGTMDDVLHVMRQPATT